MKAIIIADDMTGAAEVAGAALRHGLSAEVHVDEPYDSSADVVVVDADSRSCSPSAASAIVSRITKRSIEQGAPILLKKVDSLLRGPVLAELSAMQAAAGLDRCLLVCGNPRKRRVIIDGCLLVDGVPLHATEFAFDPEHPRATSSAVELLLNGVQCDLALHPQYLREHFRVIDPGEPATASVSIGNVVSVSDLENHVEKWWLQRQTTLAAGGAEFIEVVLQRCLGESASNGEAFELFRSMASANEILLISGTSTPHLNDWPQVNIQEPLPLSQCVSDICQMLVQRGRAAIRTFDFAEGTPDSCLGRLTMIAGQVLANSRPSQVWIEGGRTASTLLRELGYQQLKALFNFGDGIVALRSPDENSPLYVVKPGSYPWSMSGLEMHHDGFSREVRELA